jgi:hypothetical protein
LLPVAGKEKNVGLSLKTGPSMLSWLYEIIFSALPKMPEEGILENR